MLLAVLAAVATPLIVSCARSERVLRASAPADCIQMRTIRDYDALNASNIIIFATGNDVYHVVLTSPSIAIEDEFAIGVYDAADGLGGDGRICPYGRDAIIIEGPLTEEIRIRSIERIDEARLDALRIEFGAVEEGGIEVIPELLP
jgi:hypothetical protein